MTTANDSNIRFLHAFLGCSDELQKGVKEMMNIVFDPESDEDERQMALVTIEDALYPNE